MTDIKEVGRQLMIQEYRLQRANDILRVCRRLLVQNKRVSDRIDFHMEACENKICDEVEQTKMEVILEFAQIIWQLGPGEVDKWIAQKAAEAGVLEATARLTTKTFKRSLFNEELEDICTAEAHRRHVLDGTYTPPSEQQLEQLRKACAQVKENPESVVGTEEDKLQTFTNDLVDTLNRAKEHIDRISKQLTLANDANQMLEKQVIKLSDGHSQELLQLSALLAAWVQATKGGAHGLLVELLVERTEEVLG